MVAFLVHRSDHDFRDSGLQAGVQQLRRGSAGADAGRHGDLGFLRRELVVMFGIIAGTIWFFFYTWKRSVKMQAFMDRLMLRLADLRRCHPQSHDGALDAHAGDDVRRRRAAGRSARFRRRRIRATTSTTSRPRESSRKSAPAPASRRPCRTAEVFPNMVLQMVAIGEEAGSLDAMLSQGRRLLRAGGGRRRRSAVQPDGTDDHGGAGHADRRHGDRHVPADLQDGRGGLTGPGTR